MQPHQSARSPVGQAWPGIDATPPDWAHLFKIDFDSIAHLPEAEDAVRAIDHICRDAGLWPATIAVPDAARRGNYLLAFSAHFFRECAALAPLRPACLTQPSLRGDDLFPEVSTEAALRRLTPHVLLKVETADAYVIARIRTALTSVRGVRLRAEHGGQPFQGGRNSLGYEDGTSNLAEIAIPVCPMSAPFGGQVFVPNGDQCTAGGTYLVLRRYRLDLARWRSDDVALTTPSGRHHAGNAARDRIVGRRASDGAFVDDVTGAALPDEEAFVANGPAYSHARKANPRGHGTTLFGDPIRPRRLRLLRRVFEDISAPDGSELLFMAFQRDIQTSGFEFIHNHWLMAKGFMQMADPLLDPEQGFVAPRDAGYYFVPRHDKWFGKVFFDAASESIET